MHLNFNQHQKHVFNDYTLSKQSSPNKFLPSHERCQSSGSVYYQNNFSRKKLTVTSRDNSRSDLKGDYLMTENITHFNSTHRNKNQNIHYHLSNNVSESYGTSINNSQAPSYLTNSGIHRNKLKRSTSPSPMTPTKVLKLKKSIIKQNNQYSNVLLKSHNTNLSSKKYQSQNSSPLRIGLQSNRKLIHHNQPQSNRRFITQPQVQQSYDHNNRNETNISSAQYYLNLQDLKRQLFEIFQNKTLQIQEKINHQQQIIKRLETKLQQNSIKLVNKQNQISALKSNTHKKTILNQNKANKTSQENQKNYFQHLNQRINDIEIKSRILTQNQHKCEFSQQIIGKKVDALNSLILNFNNFKFQKIKHKLNQFINQKTQLCSSLVQSISCLDNKMIGRTQALKETIADLKQKVKEFQDSWTHKQTKDTTNRDKSYDDVTETFNFSNKNLKHFQNKLKQLTTLNSDNQKNQRYKQQDSLDYSLTSYDQNTKILNKQNKNVYYDQNINQMSDLSVAGFAYNKNQMSNLTDDFYYPSSSKNSSKNISPITNKVQINQYYQSGQQNSNKFKKKQTDILQALKNNINKAKQQSPVSLHVPKQVVVKISNQAIHKKIQSIQQLIDAKKVSSCQQIQKGRLRCFVDKSGYLKYTDSKTFVFDKKGNLISCTEGQFWFLVTKGLIYGKKQEDESHTMSFIQYDQ